MSLVFLVFGHQPKCWINLTFDRCWSDDVWDKWLRDQKSHHPSHRTNRNPQTELYEDPSVSSSSRTVKLSTELLFSGNLIKSCHICTETLLMGYYKVSECVSFTLLACFFIVWLVFICKCLSRYNRHCCDVAWRFWERSAGHHAVTEKTFSCCMTNTIFFAFQNLNRFVFFLTGTLINKSQLITHTHKRLYSLEAYI